MGNLTSRSSGSSNRTWEPIIEPMREPPRYYKPPPEPIVARPTYKPVFKAPESYDIWRSEMMVKRVDEKELDQLNSRLNEKVELKIAEENAHKSYLKRVAETTKFFSLKESSKPKLGLYSFYNINSFLQDSKSNDTKYFPIRKEKPELTEKMLMRVDDALRSHPSKPLVEIDGAPLIGKDINTLSGLNWLNDEVINAYMSLIVKRGSHGGYKKVYAFNTFFYPKLRESGYNSVRRWTRKVDIFSYDFLLVPVHKGNHWCLAFINFNNKTISYYDSLGGFTDGCCDRLLQYLKEESTDKKKQDFDGESWRLIDSYRAGIPRQYNSADCGVFACTYGEYLTRQAKLDFKQDDMPYFRNKMIYELITTKILD